VSVSLIFAGALGNIIDSTFYGLLFSASTPFEKAILFPPEGGYASLFHGAVVDMFYFPIWEGRLPEWVPNWGGEHFVFFRPVFNIADAAITVGVAMFILVQRKPSVHEGMVQPSPSADERPDEPRKDPGTTDHIIPDDPGSPGEATDGPFRSAAEGPAS
jgi:signal peptidase II